MQFCRGFLILLVLLLSIPAFAQQTNSSAPPVHIAGVVLSLSDNILDLKPAATPAVWVTIPADLHVDRSALKEGVNVSVQAFWADTCYVATQITVQK
ncbi:MAG TPA: hypothetical protein VEJ38_04390 [Candidatus Acidoferrales bacterium]|nr:hypothetical protein [Candidatus Acidoferrales bacterium]